MQFYSRAEIKLQRYNQKFQRKILFLTKLRQYDTAASGEQIQWNLSWGICFLLYISRNLLNLQFRFWFRKI